MELNEERVVHFGNETAPQFGWCVIMMGGPGSGKSVAVEGGSHWIKGGVKILGDFKIYNPDKLKELFIKLKQDNANDTITLPTKDGSGWEVVDLTTATVMYPPDDENAKEVLVGEPYTMKNPRYTAFLHDRLSGLSKKWRNQILSMGNNADASRLPNILFDMTGDNFDKVRNMTVLAKEAGYKVGIVWALATLPTSIRRDAKRIRTVGAEKVFTTYKNVREVADKIARSTWFKDVDEMWVVVTESVEYFDSSEIDSKGYPINVYHVSSAKELDDIVKKHISIEPYMNDWEKFKVEFADILGKDYVESIDGLLNEAYWCEQIDDCLYHLRYNKKK